MIFSFYSLGIILAILLPNVLFLVFPPMNQPATLRDGGTLINIIEHGGRIAFLGLFLFPPPHAQPLEFSHFFILTIIFIFLYYALWIRYFRAHRDFRRLTDRVFWIPVPMAVFPLLAFLCAVLWLKASLSLPALVFFAVGHLVNTLISAKQIPPTH